MLTRARRPENGFSLIELMVTIALIGLLLALGVPAFGKWTADAHVRAAAESLTNAIRLTQSMAIAKSRVTMFALTAANPPAYNSTPSGTGSNWIGEINPLAGYDETASASMLLLKSTEGTQHNVSISGPALLCFSSVGRQTNLTSSQTSLGTACTVAASDTSPTATTYVVSNTNATRKFNVVVYLGGRVRMCDAAKTLSSSNPDGC